MDIIHNLYIAIVREYASQVWVLYLLKDQQTLENFACKVCLKQWNSNYPAIASYPGSGGAWVWGYPAMHLELLPHIGIKRNYLWRIYRGFWGLVVNRLSWLSGRALAAQARCPGFDSRRLPAFSLSSIFTSKHLISLYNPAICSGHSAFLLWLHKDNN